jgi:carboxyl-terminal processing protease
MRRHKFGPALCLVAMLAGCGGGGGGSTGGGDTAGPPTPAPPPPPPSTSACSLRERQNWVAAQMREWYLFPETLPANLDPTPYTNLEDYLDALTATARAQRRDRYFTYVTSIAEENAFYASGSSAGFGVRLSYDEGARRLFVTEAFENAPALNAGIDRGTEITGIGTSQANIRAVSDIFASGGSQAVSDALGPSTTGTSRVLRLVDASGTRTVTVAKADYNITPVSSRYGGKIIDNGGQKVGYVNLRTFIDTADPALRQVFANFRANGIANVVVDLRYNGGGLVSIADLMADLLGGNRSTSEVFEYQVFRPEKANFNSQHNFAPKAESIPSTRIAFIGTGGTASASELVINGFQPYLRSGAALVGTNTYGKPVGQIAIDRAACDDRLRVIAFATQNGARQGDYYDGLATKMDVTCRAEDDVTHPLGDPAEASIRTALDFLAGRSCSRIGAVSPAGASAAAPQRPRELLMPDRPSTPQREVPGTF